MSKGKHSRVFSISDALSTGWRVFKKKWLFLLGISLLMMVIQFIPNVLTGALGESAGVGLTLLISLFGISLSLIVSMGWIYILLLLIRGRNPKAEDLFAKSNLIFKYLGGVILSGLIIMAPLLLVLIVLVMAGGMEYAGFSWTIKGANTGIIVAVVALMAASSLIYLSLKYMFVSYLIIDKGVGPVVSLQLSSQLTQGVKWKLLGFMFLTMFINIVGLVALGVGLLVTLPVTTLAYVRIYDQLVADTNP